MGCGDTCPVHPGKRYLDWELEDPAGLSVERVGPIVDKIDRRVRMLLIELLPTAHIGGGMGHRILANEEYGSSKLTEAHVAILQAPTKSLACLSHDQTGFQPMTYR